MWRVISIYDLEEKCNIKNLYLNAIGGSYSITFYNTISKNIEEMTINFIVGLWTCSVANKLRKFNYCQKLMNFICSRYNWNLEYVGCTLHVVDKYFLRVEEKLKLLKPFKRVSVYGYGDGFSQTTLQNIIDAGYKIIIEDGIVKIQDAEFELLCSEDKFNISYTKYCVMRGKRNAK